MGKIYFLSDTHFGHHKMLEMGRRPFLTIEEHDETIIKNWNDTVGPEDEIYFLGDFTMNKNPKYVHEKYTSRLLGKKYFIRGNHDKFLKQHYEKHYPNDWIWVKDYHTINLKHKQIILFHWPICEWQGFHRGSVHVYGHCHSNPIAGGGLNLKGNLVNASVCLNDYKPIALEDLEKVAKWQRENYLNKPMGYTRVSLQK